MGLNYLEYALRLLGRKNYSRKDMSEKLLQKGATQEEVEQVMERLTEWKYLDDRVFARNFIQKRLKLQPRGEFLLKLELLRKGIPEEDILSGLSELHFSEKDSAREVLQKKNRALQCLPEKKRFVKAASLLKNRGFRPEIISETVSDFLKALA